VRGLHYSADKVCLVENGVLDPGPADRGLVRKIRSQCKMADDGVLIGTVGRLFDHHKRVSDLLRALDLVLKDLPATRLLVVGDGVDAEMLKRLATELGVESNVTFVGYQGDTRPYFEAMDIYVHPAAEEAFGLVIVEAMYAGLPVIASRVGGIPDVVEEGKTATLVPDKNPEMMANAILALARDAEQRRQFGEAGRARATQLFTMDRYVAEIDVFYRRTLKEMHPALAAQILRAR